jgi:predicted ATPase
VQQQGHPLQRAVQELKMHRRGDELALTLLTEAAVAEYLTARFPGTTLPDGLVRLVYQRTEGNPLFMVNVVDAWEAQGWLEEGAGTEGRQAGVDELAQGVPESLRQMLVQQLEQLSHEEQRVLTAASAAGVEFSAAAVAAALDMDVVEAERRCEGLARRQQWLRSVGIDEWPDGTVAGRYAFIHALYHSVAYGSVTAARLIHLHRRLGAGEEEAFGIHAREIAAELALHFERGRDYHKAVQYLRHAAETAGQRHAHREAIQYLRRALGLLKAIPDGAQGLRQELELQLALGPALMVTRGFAALEVADTYARARQLCEQLGDQPRLFPVVFGLWRSSHVRGHLEAACVLGQQLVSLATRQNDPTLLVEAHGPLGQTLCVRGELSQARAHLQRVVTLYESARHSASAARFGYDPGIYAHAIDAILQFMRREGNGSLEQLEESLMLSTEHGFPYLQAVGTVLCARSGPLAAHLPVNTPRTRQPSVAGGLPPCPSRRRPKPAF